MSNSDSSFDWSQYVFILIFGAALFFVGYGAGTEFGQNDITAVCDYLEGAVEGEVCIKDGQVVYKESE